MSSACFSLLIERQRLTCDHNHNTARCCFMPGAALISMFTGSLKAPCHSGPGQACRVCDSYQCHREGSEPGVSQTRMIVQISRAHLARRALTGKHSLVTGFFPNERQGQGMVANRQGSFIDFEQADTSTAGTPSAMQKQLAESHTKSTATDCSSSIQGPDEQ